MKKIICILLFSILINMYIPVIYAESIYSKQISSRSLSIQEDLPTMIKRIQPSVVYILSWDEEPERIASGSGFFISNEGDIITNRHVLMGADSADIKIGGELYPITHILAEDIEHDLVLAAVDIPKELVQPLIISDSIPTVGEKIAVIGSPLGFEQTVSEGIISGIRDIQEYGKVIQITAPISAGSSGSPVVNMKGEVIGVVTFQIVEGQNMNFAIPVEKARNLERNKHISFNDWQTEDFDEWLATPEGLYFLGIFLYLEEEYDAAIKAFQKAIEKNSKYAEAHNLLGMAYDELERYQEAITAYKKALNINEKYEHAHYCLAITYIKIKSYDEAIEHLKQTKSINRENARAYYSLGWVYDEIEQYGEALLYYAEAINLNPHYYQAHCYMGLTYLKVNRPEFAKECLKEALRLNPDNAEAHFYMGLAYMRLEDTVAALNQYRILKTLDTESANILFDIIYD